MSLRPDPPPKAQGAFGVVAAPRREPVGHGRAKASRLDEVLATGVVYGTPVAYGLATEQDKALTRSLKKASLGDATGAPCVPLSFDPDYCKRFDKFYALGLAVASSIATLAASEVALFSYISLAAHIRQTLETECGSKWSTAYISEMLFHDVDNAATIQFCNDLETAIYSTDGALMQLMFSTGFSPIRYSPVSHFQFLAETVKAIVLGATRTGYALYTGNYRGLGNNDADRTVAEKVLVAAAIKLVASKVDEFARGIASYLRMNMRLWLRGGLRALKSSPYLNPVTFARMVRYDILNDDDDEYVNPEAEADPPPLEPQSPRSPPYREYVPPPPGTPPKLRRFSSGVDGIVE